MSNCKKTQMALDGFHPCTISVFSICQYALGVLLFALLMCFSVFLFSPFFCISPFFLYVPSMQTSAATSAATSNKPAVDDSRASQTQAAAAQSLLSLAAKCHEVAEKEGMSTPPVQPAAPVPQKADTPEGCSAAGAPSVTPPQTPAKQGSGATDGSVCHEQPTTPQKKPVGEKRARKEHDDVCDESLEEAARRVFLYLHQRECL